MVLWGRLWDWNDAPLEPPLLLYSFGTASGGGRSFTPLAPPPAAVAFLLLWGRLRRPLLLCSFEFRSDNQEKINNALLWCDWGGFSTKITKWSEVFFDKNHWELPPSKDPQAAAAARGSPQARNFLPSHVTNTVGNSLFDDAGACSRRVKKPY